MNNNTIVIASDSNYVWGVFLLISSIRKSGMDEPILVLAKSYSEEDFSCLRQFSNVRFVNYPESRKSMACSKPIAMLCADTEYITWVDCDGIFTNNCSHYLTSSGGIHFRLRDKKENAEVFKKHYRKNDIKGEIPKHILKIWREDIGENIKPLFDTCGSSCFFSVHNKYRYLLEKWRDQIDIVLPDDNVGVVDNRSEAYFQTDESVLNSLLMFSRGVSKPDEYKLNKDPNASYIHFTYLPKPWQMWNSYTIKYFDIIVELVEWAISQNLMLPKGNKIPFALKRKNKKIVYFLAKFSSSYMKLNKIIKGI